MFKQLGKYFQKHVRTIAKKELTTQ